MTPFRPTFFNVPAWAQIVLYCASSMTLLILGFGLWRHISMWRRGRPIKLPGNWKERLKNLVTFGPPIQKRIWERLYPGLFHAGILWGFLVLFLGTAIATIDHDIGVLLFDTKLLKGSFYLFYELILDIFGFLCTIGIIAAIYRRYAQKPSHILATWGFSLWSLLFINSTGFLLEGFRLALEKPDWARWSPIGFGIARLLDLLPSGGYFRNIHIIIWMIHLLSAMAFIAAIPFNNSIHLITSALNVFFKRLKDQPPAGVALPSLDIGDSGYIGAGDINDFTWKQRLGFDACTRCGRCSTVCPALNAGAALDPKKLIVGLDEYMKVSMRGSNAESRRVLCGDVIKADELWACTSCMACMQVCPVFVETVEDIVEMRRFVTEKGLLPETAAKALEDMWTLKSAWGQPPEDRANWIAELNLGTATPDDRESLLYWIGDTSTYNGEAQEISKAMAKILEIARLNPVTLGAQDGTDGEAARRLGEEGLFQSIARANIARLHAVNPERIVTHCPHTFNTFRNEYPEFGGDFNVVHHSQLLLELLQSGRLHPTRELKIRLTYHDPCYLGRYNGIYDAPREVLRSLPGVELIEMDHHGEDAVCCGGGGGLMWLDVESTKRMNYRRFEEAEELEVDVVITACPYCKIMLEEAASYNRSRVRVMDLAEIVLETGPEVNI